MNLGIEDRLVSPLEFFLHAIPNIPNIFFAFTREPFPLRHPPGAIPHPCCIGDAADGPLYLVVGDGVGFLFFRLHVEPLKPKWSALFGWGVAPVLAPLRMVLIRSF